MNTRYRGYRYNRKQVLESRSWSHSQLAIFAAVKNTDRHLMVEAVAGAGKTTAIEGIVASCPSSWKVKVLAFNVHIVEELQHRLPKSITVTTVHRMGLTMLTRSFGGTIFQPNDRKYRDICQRAVERNTVLQKPQLQSARRYLEKVVHFAQVTLNPLSLASLEDMCEYYSLYPIDEEGGEWLDVSHLLPLVPDILREGERAALDKYNVGLDDLLWLPHHWNLPAPPADLLIVDEAQDANAAMIDIYRRLVGNQGRIVIVGDPNQAIYGFSGSDAYSWSTFRTIFHPIELPLSVTYRCPRSHVALAKQLISRIEAVENAIEGVVMVISPAEIKDRVQPLDLVLCRFTAPLVGLCLKLVACGKPAKVRGRNIGEGLSALARSAAGKGFAHLRSGLQDYAREMIQNLHSQGLYDLAALVEDKKLALEACLLSFGDRCASLQEFCRGVEDLFADNGVDRIVLSTIHRAKGDQADRVFLLGCDLLPYLKFAKLPWQIQQEYNLQYVALTRSRETLYLVPFPQDRDRIPALLHEPLGGMTFPESMPAPLIKRQKIIPIEWHNKELIREFYLEYTPQVGDKVRKKGLYGWDGDVLQVDQEKSLILWYGCGKIPDPPYPLWEDNNNLILASWRKYE